MQILDWQKCLKEPGKHSISGNVKIIKSFAIPQLNRRRRIWIYLPPDYEENQDRRYPVLYMHDGQNVFDSATSYSGEWYVDETMETLFEKKLFSGAIVVAVENSKYRMSEYMPGQEGDEYIKFIVYNLKPFIDYKFRTLPFREFTGLAGSSMGGLISLYGGLRYQSTFSRIGAFSPAMGIGWDSIEQFNKIYSMNIYIDVGTAEVGKSKRVAKKYLQNAVNSYEKLKQIGFTQDELRLVIAENANHSEGCWAKRFPEAFLWLYS